MALPTVGAGPSAAVVVFTPTSISNLYAWFDLSDISTLYQDAAKTTPVAANNDVIGAMVDQSGNGRDATQSTTSKKPLYKINGIVTFDRVYHDRVDDVLNIASVPAGDYTVAIATFSGKQIYTRKQNTTGTWTINAADVYQLVIADGALSAGDETALSNWLDDQREAANASDVMRVLSSSTSINLSITESGSSGATWELGDGQTATGTSCVKTLAAAPDWVVLRATSKASVTRIEWSNKNLFGQLFSFAGLTSLQVFYCDNNQLTGSIPLLAGLTSLQLFFCGRNQLTGSIPDLTGLTSLERFYCGINQLTGSIPDLTGLTSLQEFLCDSNQLTGSIPDLTGLTSLQKVYCNGNKLTGSIPSLTGLTSLQQFYCDRNQLTGSMPSLTGLTSLQQFFCGINQLTGSIPSLTGLTSLQQFYCDNNQLTGYTASTIPTSLTNFRAQGNLLTQAAVDQILSDFVAAGHSNGTLNLDGTGNAAPSASGLTDKSTLQSRGWTVTTN